MLRKFLQKKDREAVFYFLNLEISLQDKKKFWKKNEIFFKCSPSISTGMCRRRGRRRRGGGRGRRALVGRVATTTGAAFLRRRPLPPPGRRLLASPLRRRCSCSLVEASRRSIGTSFLYWSGGFCTNHIFIDESKNIFTRPQSYCTVEGLGAVLTNLNLKSLGTVFMYDVCFYEILLWTNLLNCLHCRVLHKSFLI